jgi:phage terminase large subunit-like protein
VTESSFMEALGPERRAKLLSSLDVSERGVLAYDWSKWARPKQLPPEGDWDGWLLLGGRGMGKTRVGSEWVRSNVENKLAGRIALIAETSADGRDVIVEGDSGILAVSPPWFRPVYEPSKRRLTWPNGAIATLYDAREPDQLRGPQHDLAWMDEAAKYRYLQAVYDNLLMGLRLGDHPRWLATTTPRPIALVKAWLKDPRVVVTRGSTMENLSNLAPSFRMAVVERYRGTRLGRQELDAEVLEDVPGALWTRRLLDENRVDAAPDLKRVWVGVDPAASSGERADETGIVCGGVCAKNHGYLLDDWSLKGTPDAWGRRAVAMYRRYEADGIVAEKNQGGEMVSHVIRSVAPDVPVHLVHASRGKYVRAEPVSALYEQGRIHHVGVLPELEDQMIEFTPESAEDRVKASKDRVDATVWLWSHLFPTMTGREPKKQPINAPLPIGRGNWMGA